LEIASKFKNMENVNIEAKEREAGSIARVALKASLLNQIKTTFSRRSGDLEKSNVSARYKGGSLDRLAVSMPKYSFQNHFGSTLPGTQKISERKGANVKSFSRHLQGKTIAVSGYTRSGGSVSAMVKNRKYVVTNHIAKALKQTNALENLATALGNNRAVSITSQINF
jgi:hypothetical protein